MAKNIDIDDERDSMILGNFSMDMRINSSNPNELEKEILQFINPNKIAITNYTKQKEDEEKLSAMMSIFLYGLLLVISLIGITNIYNTITASREAKKRRFTSTGSKVVSMNGRGVEVYVIKPQDFAEAQTAADLLKEGRTVVINLEGVELTVAQRSIDFVGGATYAINGSLQAVSNNIFIAAPDSIEVSGDLKSEIMNENTISPQLK